MATNDPRVPPEVQEKIRELEQELNEGKYPAFSAEYYLCLVYFQHEYLKAHGGWIAAAGYYVGALSSAFRLVC